MNDQSSPLVELAGVSKSFGGVHAVKDVTLQWRSGHIYGLIGPNGAGKSTLVNIVTGLTRPDSGTVHVRGTNVVGWSPYRIARLGVGRTFQTSILMEDETVLTNVVIGTRVKEHGQRRARHSEAASHEKAHQALEHFGLAAAANVRAGDLSYGLRRLVEVARILVSPASVLLLDEPAAGLPHGEAEQLTTSMRAFIADSARAVVLIEHNVRLVLQTCDEIAFLVQGAVVDRGDPEHIRNSPAVIESYLGTSTVSEVGRARDL